MPCPRVMQGCQNLFRWCPTERVQLLLDSRTMSYSTREGLFTRAVFLLDRHISTYPFLFQYEVILHTYCNGRDLRRLSLTLLNWFFWTEVRKIKHATYFLEVGKENYDQSNFPVEIPSKLAFYAGTKTSREEITTQGTGRSGLLTTV